MFAFVLSVKEEKKVSKSEWKIEDVINQLKKVKTLKRFAPLLLPVDSRPGSGEDMIYGLGGKV